MKAALGVLVLAFAACNYDAGECYVRGEEGEGAGGGVIVSSTGVGAYGSVPLEPQNAPDAWDPCSSQTAECTVTWKAGSDICKSWGEAGTCTSRYQGQHATLEEALARCEMIYGVGEGSEAQSCGPCKWVQGASGPVEQCKKLCDRQYEACCKPCTTKSCYAACMNIYKECLKDCEK